MLRQPQYAPLSVQEQIVQIYAATPQDDRDSWVRNVPVEEVERYANELSEYMRTSGASVLSDIADQGALSEDLEKKLRESLDAFGKVFEPQRTAAA